MKIPSSFIHPQPATRRALLAAALALPLCPLARADYASEVLSDHPIMYYRFDDGVTTDDISTPETNLGSLGAAGNGVLSDTLVRQAPGALPGSADVSANVAGTGMSVPYTAGLNYQGSFSAEVWLKPSTGDIPAFQCPIASWRENTDTFGREGWLIYQGAAADGFNFRTYNKNGAATAVSISSGPGIVAGQWHHVAVTWNGATSIGKIYVNGVLKATSPVIAPGGTNSRAYDANTSMPYTLGARSDNAFGWTGGVDEPAYYANKVLSDAQVLAHYNNGINPSPPQTYGSVVLADAPAGYWRMNNAYVFRTPPVAANQGTLTDPAAGGKYFAGAKNAATGPSSAGGFGGFGASNSCLSLPAANGYVGTALAAMNDRSAFTLTGWVKRGAVHSARGGYFGQNDVLELGDATAGADIEAYSASAGSMTTPYPFADNAWGFVAYVADGTQVRLFMNGELVKSITSSTANYGNSAYNFNIGGGGIFAPTGDNFRGEIDEVAVFDKALDGARVKQLYDTALGNVPPALVDTYPAVTPAGDIPEGRPYSLTINPTGTPPFTYQWKLDGVDIAGATSQTYTVAAAVPNPGDPFSPFNYTVVVTNSTNQSVTSDPAQVYVIPSLKWTSADASSPGNWDIGTSLNWKTFSAGTPSTYSDDYAVVFNDDAAVTAVNLVEDLHPQAIVFENETKDYAFTGDHPLASYIVGGNLVKNGAGSVEFANTSLDFNVAVNDGIFRIGNGVSGSLFSDNLVTVDGGDFQVNPAAGGIFANKTTVTSGRISFVGSGAMTSTATIGGAGDEWFDRAGEVVVAGPNNLAGAVTIHSGTVIFDGNQDGNRLAANKIVTVDPGATMEIRGVNGLPTAANSVSPTLTQATLRVVTGASAGNGANGTSHAHLKNLGLNASSVVLAYSGSGGAYDGESFQLNGNLTVGGAGASSISLAAGTNTGNSGVAISATPNHTMDVSDVGAGPDLVISAELENTDAGAAASAAATVFKTGAGTLRLAGGIAHGFSGTLQIDGGTVEADGSYAGPLNVSAAGTIAPGNSAGSFAVGATSLAGTYACEIDGAAGDKLIVNGNLAFAPGAKIQISILAGGATAQAYEIVKCNGAISGPLPAIDAVPGYSAIKQGSSIILIQNGASLQPRIAATPGTGNSDFNANGGGYSATSPAPVTSEAAWNFTAGSWRSNGQQSGFGADNTAWLLSPIYNISQAGAVTLTFVHRYSFEAGYDGGAVDVSVNGGAFTRVPGISFSQNGYNTTLGDVGHSLANGQAFGGNSPGHPAFITSICSLANVAAGNTIQVRFVSASDNNTSGDLTPQGWEIDSVNVSGGQPSLATLTWPVGIMQYSDNLQPPWTDIQAASPLVIDTKAAPKRFFRLKP